MMMLDHLQSLSRFNQAMNEKIFQTALQLPAAVPEQDKGAFFGSIMGTLNHMVVTDTCWLKRFRAHPAKFAALAPLDEVAFPDWYDTRMAPTLALLFERRKRLDAMIIQWTDELQAEDLAYPLPYQNMRGKDFCKPFGHLALHLFHHQIHHRGQVTTMLSQENLHVDGTGVLPFVPEGDG